MTTIEAPVFDEAKLEAFMGKVVDDLSGTMTTFFCSIGDRLGLFRDLAENGPATSEELAARTAINERYAAEWLRGLAAAGYLERQADTGRYALPPEHAEALAREGGPMFVGGAYEMLPGMARTFDGLVDAFRHGGGIAQDAYDRTIWAGMQRFTDTWFENHLLQEWIPAVPHIQAKLEQGIRVADVGCGSGRALLKLAPAFPNSTFVGYDAFEGQLSRAVDNAARAGLAERVRFELADAGKGLPEQYDLITTFDVIHDAVDPAGLVHAIRQGLTEKGHYLMLEVNCADRHEDNVGPLAAMFYGFSVFYCLTTSLAGGGAGLGTCGMPEAKVRELCTAAGFSEVTRLPIEDPFSAVYEARA
ncbi:MAG TPA: class I SAM-dependent methyltransferase [Gaiellaceae bacterium]|nr:class I SAM-dependent methyltransferase [Gaiellaceae bacterium]